jgi:hypothetical protein
VSKVNKKTAVSLAGIMGVLGMALILAGPAFHLIDSKAGLYAGLVCWLVGGALGGYARRGND